MSKCITIGRVKVFNRIFIIVLYLLAGWGIGDIGNKIVRALWHKSGVVEYAVIVVELPNSLDSCIWGHRFDADTIVYYFKETE